MLEQGFYNCDCMVHLCEYPDDYFDLAVVDPPYGGGGRDTLHTGASDGRFGNKDSRFEKYRKIKAEWTGGDGGGWRNSLYGKKITEWDNPPSKEYFSELFRISKNQIIWGGNYFGLPPTRCFLVWRKLTISENFSMAMAEYAWTSFNENAKVFEKAPQDTRRFHPTQKPVELYTWCLSHFAKSGDKILDTHVGSASSLIACERMGLEYVGYEIDKEYYELAKERLEQERAQLRFDI